MRRRLKSGPLHSVIRSGSTRCMRSPGTYIVSARRGIFLCRDLQRLAHGHESAGYGSGFHPVAGRHHLWTDHRLIGRPVERYLRGHLRNGRDNLCDFGADRRERYLYYARSLAQATILCLPTEIQAIRICGIRGRRTPRQPPQLASSPGRIRPTSTSLFRSPA